MGEEGMVHLSDVAGFPNFNLNGDINSMGFRWKKWLQSFELFAKGKGVANPKQLKSLMLHHAGRAVQDIFFSIEIPEPDENNADMNNVYKVAVVKLNEHFTPHINVTYERSVFRSMCQLPGESIDKYITRLKQKAQYCNFGDESEMIRDQVIEKCTSHRLRRKLLERADVNCMM